MQPPEATLEGVKAAIRGAFAEAQLLDIRPPDSKTDGVRWIGIRFGGSDTCYVGVTDEALDHPQNLVKQLHDQLDQIGPGRAAQILLRDWSRDSRYGL